MTQIVDFSSPQNLGAIKGHGWAGIVRYVSDYHPKNITSAEFQEAMALGLTVTLVMEQGNQPALRGAAGGSHDAQIANEQADGVGYGRGSAIYYVAEDPNQLSQSEWPVVDQYFDAVKAHGGRPVGAYGGHGLVTHLMASGRATYGWCVQTWGGAAGVHLCQLVGANTYGMAVDVDDVLAPDYGQHPRGGGPPSPPPPGHHAPDGNPFTMLAVDGQFGPTTTSGLQWSLNHTGAHPPLAVDGQFGPASKKALQARLNAVAGPVTIDGNIGPQTVKSLQRHVGVPQDGQWGPQTTRGMQSKLNAGTF